MMSETDNCANQLNMTEPPASSGAASRVLKGMLNAFFYLGLIAILVFAFVNVTGSRTNRSLWGFFFFEVLTDSMQSTIPQGSLAVVRETGAESIEVGDTITFFSKKDVKVTHQVVEIIENYDGTQERGFQTKGTNNPLPDTEIVRSRNVVGKVVFHIVGFHDAIGFIKDRWQVLLIPIAGITAIAILSQSVRRSCLSDRKDVVSYEQ